MTMEARTTEEYAGSGFNEKWLKMKYEMTTQRLCLAMEAGRIGVEK